jgi:hypothetical protein
MVKHPLNPVIRAVSLGICPLEPVDHADPFLGSLFPEEQSAIYRDTHQLLATRFPPLHRLSLLRNSTYKLDAIITILPTF